MLNIFHARIASAARRHITSPLPSWMRLWSTLYPVGAAVADAPTSEYEKPESFCLEIKRRISPSDGAVRLNTVYPFFTPHPYSTRTSPATSKPDQPFVLSQMC